MTALTLEHIVEQIPTVRAALAEDIQRRRDAVAAERAQLIAGTLEAEQAAAALQQNIEAADAGIKEALTVLDKARQAKNQILAERSALLATASANRSRLHKEFGNAVVTECERRVASFIHQKRAMAEGLRQSLAAATPEDRHYSPARAMANRRRLESLQQEIVDLELAHGDLSTLVLSSGHPDDIRAKAERIAERVFGVSRETDGDDRAQH